MTAFGHRVWLVRSYDFPESPFRSILVYHSIAGYNNIFLFAKKEIDQTSKIWQKQWIWQKQSFTYDLQNWSSEKFCKFHRKMLVLKSLFNKVSGLKVCNFFKKSLQHMSFPMKFVKFPKVPFFTEHLWWWLLEEIEKALKTWKLPKFHYIK